MNFFANMHPVSVVVIVMILMLFILSVVLLMTVSTSYRKQKKLATVGDTHRSALVRDVLQEFTAAYNTFGQETNTPAIITSVIHEDMSFFLFCERFLNNAVSLFVTMGLLGTFLGLSLSVSSLSQLLGSTADWQNALNNMGSGLLSALSGMGVAFYTSLVGVGCSIILTILRSIFNPEAIREEPPQGGFPVGQADDWWLECCCQCHQRCPEGYDRRIAAEPHRLQCHGGLLQPGCPRLLGI